MKAAPIAGLIAMTLAAGPLQAWANAPGLAEAPPTRKANISVHPSSGPVGKHVTVTGSGWPGSCPVSISFTDAGVVTSLGTATPSGGAFQVLEVIPSTAAVGRGKVTAHQNFYNPAIHRCSYSGPTAKRPFTVTAFRAMSLSG